MEQPESRDPFAEIVGRALIEPGYRDLLINGSEEAKRAALTDAGVTEEHMEDVLVLLVNATSALNALAGHHAFGFRTTAA